MLIARVVGEMVATRKHPSHEGRNLLLVQPLDLDGSNRGDAVIALDAVGAGTGETIYWCRGKEAGFPFLPVELPTEATIVGIVDSVNIPPN